MYLQKLKLTNFKNYETADLGFSEKINCFVGDNGVGKTNLMDAIYYLSFCKSYFNPQDMMNIRHTEDAFAIHGTYLRNENQSDSVSCIQRRNQKKLFRMNKKDYDRLADHIGLFPLVIVSPSDSDLISLGSEERRKYFDGVISQFDKVYLDDLLNYSRALQHRNALLKSIAEHGGQSIESIEVWDQQMLEPGQRIFEKRTLFLKEFYPLFQNYFEFVSEGREAVNIEYESQLRNLEFKELLRSSIRKDLAMRYTTAGIHKDDFMFSISGYSAKRFGSQGQQKSLLIALKLSQFEYTRTTKGYKPILLFDDIFDKLDERRVGQLVKLVGADDFGQVFITDTQPDRIEKIFKQVEIEHRIFNVKNGAVAG